MKSGRKSDAKTHQKTAPKSSSCEKKTQIIHAGTAGTEGVAGGKLVGTGYQLAGAVRLLNDSQELLDNFVLHDFIFILFGHFSFAKMGNCIFPKQILIICQISSSAPVRFPML